jgi:hypothetical protein
MTRLTAEQRAKLARSDEMSPLEYILVACFVLAALPTAIPGLAPAVADAVIPFLIRLA